MLNRKAFTILEVLISIALMGIILVALFSSVDMLQNSNQHLLHYLKKSKKITKASKVLYSDLMGSDGNISIKKDEFSRVCIEETLNSLYALPVAKVCWVVLKKNNTLVRVEGNGYDLPLGLEERVEVDPVMKGVEIFDLYHEKDKILVLIKQEGKEPISFMLQGITKPVKKKAVVKPKAKPASKPRVRPPTNTPVVPAPSSPSPGEGTPPKIN
jgi:prepilin-type N-terminal cleavage/methylation domain-containing protein